MLGLLPCLALCDGRGDCVSILCPPNLRAGRDITVPSSPVPVSLLLLSLCGPRNEG